MSKNNSGSTWGVLALVLLIALVIMGVRGCNSLVFKMSVKSTEAQGQIVLDFEKQIYTADNEVSLLNKQIEQEILNLSENKPVDASLIEKADSQYKRISNKIEQIDIPKGLTKERKEKLEGIRKDMADQYTFKSGAMFYLSLFLRDNTPSDLQDFMTNSSLAYENMMDVATGMVTLKKELGILDTDATK